MMNNSKDTLEKAIKKAAVVNGVTFDQSLLLLLRSIYPLIFLPQ